MPRLRLTHMSYEVVPTLWDVLAYGDGSTLPAAHCLCRFVQQSVDMGLPVWELTWRRISEGETLAFTFYTIVDRVWLPIEVPQRQVALQSQPQVSVQEMPLQ